MSLSFKKNLIEYVYRLNGVGIFTNVTHFEELKINLKQLIDYLKFDVVYNDRNFSPKDLYLKGLVKNSYAIAFCPNSIVIFFVSRGFGDIIDRRLFSRFVESCLRILHKNEKPFNFYALSLSREYVINQIKNKEFVDKGGNFLFLNPKFGDCVEWSQSFTKSLKEQSGDLFAITTTSSGTLRATNERVIKYKHIISTDFNNMNLRYSSLEAIEHFIILKRVLLTHENNFSRLWKKELIVI